MTQPPEYPGTPDPNQGPDNSGSSGETPSWENGGNQSPSYDQPSYGQPSYDQPQYGQQPSYGQDPSAYGQPSYQGTPYGAWQGGNDANRGTDGVSIAAFVLNLTPCGLVIPGWICAIIGLSRTKRNGTKGRWMAITSLVMGVLWAILFAALIFGGVWLFKNVVTAESAEAGQCVNITKDDNAITLMKKDCSDEHDGEILHVGEIKDVPQQYDAELTEDEAAESVCRSVVDDEVQANVPDDVKWGIALNEDRDRGDDDPFICYVESTGDKFTEKITP